MQHKPFSLKILIVIFDSDCCFSPSDIDGYDSRQDSQEVEENTQRRESMLNFLPNQEIAVRWWNSVALCLCHDLTNMISTLNPVHKIYKCNLSHKNIALQISETVAQLSISIQLYENLLYLYMYLYLVFLFLIKYRRFTQSLNA